MRLSLIYAMLVLSCKLAAPASTLPSLPSLTELIDKMKSSQEVREQPVAYKKSFNKLEIVTQFVRE